MLRTGVLRGLGVGGLRTGVLRGWRSQDWCPEAFGSLKTCVVRGFVRTGVVRGLGVSGLVS